jgi:hypothetical protein
MKAEYVWMFEVKTNGKWSPTNKVFFTLKEAKEFIKKPDKNERLKRYIREDDTWV